MKKNVSHILSVILAICMVVSLLPAVMAVETDDTVEILLLDTSDIHGQLYATNYTNDYSQSGTHSQGLTRVATYIKEMRAQYENFYLADTGDTIQGTPLTYYFAFEEDTMPDPTVKAMRTLGYDMWVLGNHEFNYGMDILTEQVDYAIAAATEGETPITMSMANYLAAETNSDDSKDWATWRGFEPYVIKEYDGVKVAIMGIGNPGVPQWDVPENWEGIYFANPVETYDHYEEEMKEKADLIVLMSHSGIDIEGDGTGYIRQLIETHDSVDLVFSGHEHRDGVTKIKDTTGKEIPVISPSTKCSKIGQALISYNKADDTFTIDAQNVSMKNYAIDAELEALLKPYEEAAWNEYMLQPIGTASGDFSAKGLGDAPSAFMDLINQVQLHYGYDYNGLNTPDDPSDDQMAQLSISAPLTSGSAANIIPAGDIVLGDLFRLYRYENWFYQITMTGKEVKTWLEFAATNVNSNGNAGNLTYYDVIYGDGFYYEIDCTAPADSRIVRMTYNGVPVTDDQVFTVVLNNYRFNGGGNYVKYLNDHGVPFIANDPDRIIYSTQYDMIQGEDNGQARNMLANYIREKGVIDPEITSTWKIIKGVPSSFEFAVVSTTDMHGRSTEYDVATQKLDNNSMLKAATIIKDIRATYGEDMVLIDNGDTIQGNLVAQYAINQKSDVLNPMIEIMTELGYDTWTMGNHEFNFNPDQRDTQAKFALESGMTAIAANITLLENGKNMFGEDAKAGDPFYAPYVVKTLTDDYGREVKVAVIGMGNPANATWDLASNYPNMQFSALDNPEGDLAFEFQKWIDIVNEKEDVDVIIIASHNGTGNAEGTSLENQSQYAAINSVGADLVISGHDHTAALRTVTNKAGEEVKIVNAGGSNVNLNTFTVTFDANGEVADVAIETENIKLSTAEADAELAARNQHWYDETYAWASAPLGTFDNGWSAIADQFTGKNNDKMVTFQNALVDFVHKAQIWCSWQSFEDQGIEGATVSIGSAVFGTASGGVLSFVPQDGDTISTLELNKLYRYSNNLLCAIDMTGEQLWNWMNTVANYYDLDANGNVYLNSSVFGVDTFYGVDYTIDLTRPYGQRLVKATYQGQDLKTFDGKIRCTLNSYRLSGGYGFFEATGLTEADCCWTASQYLGSDRAPVPTQLGEYVAHMKTVAPTDKVSHGADTTWQIVTERVYDNPFTDVPEDSYCFEPIMELLDMGIVSGTSATTYDPARTLTRAEWVTMLWRASGSPAASASAGFTDVKSTDFFAPAFDWAFEQGIVAGVGDGKAAPAMLLTREQMVTMLFRCSGDEHVAYDLGAYADVNDVSYYAVDAFEWAVAKGCISGMSATILAPQGTSNRAQAATVLYRYLVG